MMKDLSADNVFYKRRVEELGQKLQEQNELIISQKQQVQLAGVGGGGRSGRCGGRGWGSARRARGQPDHPKNTGLGHGI